MDTFMPCPAFGLWVWQASPAMKTRGKRVCDLVLRHVVELVAKPLADLVDRPPGDLLHLERVGMQDPLRCRDQAVEGDVAARDPFVSIELVELDIDADQIAAFPRDEHDVALIGGLYQRTSGGCRESR